MKYILGIDSGATKTTAVVTDTSGDVLGRGSSGPANLHVNTQEEIKNNIKEAMESAITETGKDIDVFLAACFGGAGIDTPSLSEQARKIALDVIPLSDNKKLAIVNDAQVILPACSEKNYGVVAIAGTGSNFYGKNKEGREAWAGGLDYILSDEGSSYWIGLEVLRAAVKSADGRGPETILEDLVLGKFHIDSIRKLADVVYEQGFKKQNIAEISPLSDEAYRRGDKVAENILDEAAKELSSGVMSVISRLEMEKENFDVIIVGGTINSSYPFIEKIKTNMKAKKANVVACHADLSIGAAKIARQLLE